MTEANSVTIWPRDELERIGDAKELRLASRRPDGSLRPYVTMWVVRAGDVSSRDSPLITVACGTCLTRLGACRE
jgi:hypothetical protein